MVNDILVKKYVRYFWDPELEDKPLRPSISSVACINIRHALAILDFAVSFGNHEKKSYDEELQGAVRAFQEKQGHSAIDGYFGLRTRRLLTEALLRKAGPQVFKRFVDPVEKRPKTVFLSYARADRDRVDKLDQWLHDKEIQVIRDIHHFQPGLSIDENIKNAIALADKVIGVFSNNSKLSDWTRREFSLTKECEKDGCDSMLIYLLLDEINVPSDDPTRVSVFAKGKTLQDVGEELMRGIAGWTSSPRYKYDANEPL